MRKPTTSQVFAFRGLAMALLLGSAAVEAVHALSLGRPRGLVTISRPLDVPFAARLDGNEVPRPDCFSAEVLYGDRRVPPSDVRVSVERSGDSPDIVLRVRTRTPVDEPVVTVFLQAGCDFATTRRHVLLAEPPATPEPTLPLASSTAGAAIVPPVLAQAGNAAGGPSSRGTPAAADVSALPPKPPKPARATPPAETAELKASKGPKPSSSRLKLEPIDLETDRPLGLKASTSLQAEPSADSPEAEARRRAAKDLWAALNSTPEERIQQNTKLDEMDKRLSALSRQVAQVEQRALQSAAATEAAKAERFRNPLVYTLAALVAALAAVLAWLALKRREDRRWWQPDPADPFLKGSRPDSQLDTVRASFGRSMPVPEADQATKGWRRKLWGRDAGAATSAKPGAPEPQAGTDGVQSPVRVARPAANSMLGGLNDGFEVQSVSPSDFDTSMGSSSLPPTGASRQGANARVDSLADELDIAAGGAKRAINVEELLDVHQQVEFFAALGQFDQAADLLQTQLDIAPDSSALLYLDLLELQRRASNQEAYQQTKLRLEKRFAVKAPEWDEDSSHGRSLEEYEHAMERITALWPSPKVLVVIEESLMRRPETPEQAFDLPAYRELLMLYSVASAIVRGGAAEAAGATAASMEVADGEDVGVDVLLDLGGDSVERPFTTFRSTAIEPLQASVAEVVDNSPPAHLGLDLDLSGLGDAGPLPGLSSVTPEPARPPLAPNDHLIDFDVSGADAGPTLDSPAAPPKPQQDSPKPGP